jgi:hypothetical protein
MVGGGDIESPKNKVIYDFQHPNVANNLMLAFIAKFQDINVYN